jgi:hypothetical protein
MIESRDIDLIEIKTSLPNEIINTILEFQGYHKYRSGKYMAQLHIHDEKYEILRKKPMNDCYYNNQYGNFYKATFYKAIENKYYKILIHCIDYGEKLHWYMNVLLYSKIHKQNIQWERCNDKSVHYVHNL